MNEPRPEPAAANHATYAARAARLYEGAFDWADAGAIEASLSVSSAYSAQIAALGRLCDALGVNRTVGRHALIRVLYFSPRPRLSQYEIAAEMQVTSSNVTLLVDGLEGEGLVRRVPHPSDRRTMHVELTEEGRAFAEVIVPSMARFMAAMLEGFSDEEKRQVTGLLERFQRNAEAFDAGAVD